MLLLEVEEYLDAKAYIVHDDPAVVIESQYIAMVDLAPFGFLNELEQVWLGPLDDGLYRLQCIPFRVYGLSLFDVVRLDENDVVAAFVRSGGHRTLRAFLAPGLEASVMQAMTERITLKTEDKGLMSEWSGDRHVAIDVPGGVDEGDLTEFFREQRSLNRIFWEWSDTKPFATA